MDNFVSTLHAPLKTMLVVFSQMLRLEFDHYDYKGRGSISAKDFTLSMVASADLNHLNRLLDRVEELNKKPTLSEIRITFEEFKALFSSRKFSTLSKIQNMKIFNVF